MSSAAAGELVPEVVRDLTLAPATHPHGNTWLSATSGLVCVGAHAYVVADDEHHLGQFTLAANGPVRLIELFAGVLPRKKGKRKKEKPDLECLALLPAFDLYPHGALLALGSGSRATRNRGTLLPLDAAGQALGAPLHVDLAPLYSPLQAQFSDLNIEGAFVGGGRFHLLQRGNKGSANARISFAWEDFSAWLLHPRADVPRPVSVQLLDLGMTDGVPLTPTDGTALAGDAWLFCAVAENTACSIDDGACLASLVGIADAHGHVGRMWHLHGNPKVEGIALAPGCDTGGPELEVLLVTDDDDPQQPSRLLRCRVPL